MTERRIEDFRQDLTAAEAARAESANVRAVAMQGYLFAFPAFLHLRQLSEYLAARRQVAPAEPPLGGWLLMRELATPATTTVSPNVDTLYGAAYLLLDAHGPVVLSVPPMPERYHSVAVHDALFDCVGVVGTATHGDRGGEYLIAGPGWDGPAPPGIDEVLVSPTGSVVLYQRILAHGPEEHAAIHRLQDAVRLAPLDAMRPGGFADVDVTAFETPGLRSITDPVEFFAHTNAYTARNRRVGDADLVALLASAGVGAGADVPADDVARDAVRAGARDAQSAIDARVSRGPLRDGWRVPDPRAALRDASILDRAATQATQMGLLPVREAIYFFAALDGAGDLLRGDRGYDLTFAPGMLPPVDGLGFWSLTMYDAASSLLVANPIDRYVVRPDTPGLTPRADGGLEIRVQATRPDDVPEGNWLPAPPGGFTVALRAYLPRPAILDGTWFPPPIRPRG